MNKNRFLVWMMLTLLVLMIMQSFGAGSTESSLEENTLGMSTNKDEYAIGKEIILTLQNNTNETLIIENDCDNEPLVVEFKEGREWQQISVEEEIPCDAEDFELPAGEKMTISYKDWAYRVFRETGEYQISTTLTVDGEAQTFYSNEFTVKNRGIVSGLWLNFVYKPILNTLVFLIEVLPGHSLGFAIIILTLILRTILLIPSQRAIRSQRKMQEIQPKLDEIKRKYKDNQEKMAMETMKVWQNNKVNPFSSCLMILIQFPILIALYYVVREGLHLDKIGLLYPFVGEEFSFAQMEVNFLGILNLMEMNFIVLPLIVGGLQFIQMHLSFARAEKKRNSKKEEKPNKKKNSPEKKGMAEDIQSQMQMATKMMKYFMPAMIAFFTASLPAGVGLYWGTSTIYGILQQIVVNRESTKEQTSSEPVVRVIDNN